MPGDGNLKFLLIVPLRVRRSRSSSSSESEPDELFSSGVGPKVRDAPAEEGWLTKAEEGGEAAERCGGIDWRYAALVAVGDVVRELGEGRLACDIDWGRWKGVELIGVEGVAPR